MIFEPKAIGNTPLMRLSVLSKDLHFNVYGKLELANPTGSMKDRPAHSMLRAAIDRGEISEGGTIIESSSGNMGIALAYACRQHNLPFLCVTDVRANQKNIAIMQELGARVEVIQEAGRHASLLATRLARVQQLLQNNKGAYYWPNQYDNYENARGYEQLMAEIEDDLEGKIDVVVCATGTCGTIRGCADYVERHGLRTKIVAVDAVGSVIFGTKAGERHIPGHGSAMRPGLFRADMADQVVHVGDAQAIAGCNQLLALEGIKAGGSSGALIAALPKIAPHVAPGANIVLIIADKGERYADTIYNDDWVQKHGLG